TSGISCRAFSCIGDTRCGVAGIIPLTAIRGGWMTELLFPELRRDPQEAGLARGVLMRWLADDGSPVQVGDRLAQVRLEGEATGRTVGWVSALATGTLWHQVRPGEVLIPGAVVGLID